MHFRLEFRKRFFEWIFLKKKLDSKKAKPPLVSEGDIWWCCLGENIGTEINGKSQLFSRPVIIFKKLTHSSYLIVPTSIQERKGNWYVSFQQNDTSVVACLHQVRVVDYKRLLGKISFLNTGDFRRVRFGFKNLYIPKDT